MQKYYPTKICYKCNKKKRIIDGFNRRSGPGSNYRNECKECETARKTAWARQPKQTEKLRKKGRERNRLLRLNPEYIAKEADRRRQLNSLTPRNVFKLAIFNARKRAEVTIDEEYLMRLWLKQKGRCALSGLEMTWGQGEIKPTSLSVDRINPDRAYKKGNVRLLCHAVNAFCGRMTDSELLSMAKALVANMESVP